MGADELERVWAKGLLDSLASRHETASNTDLSIHSINSQGTQPVVTAADRSSGRICHPSRAQQPNGLGRSRWPDHIQALPRH